MLSFILIGILLFLLYDLNIFILNLPRHIQKRRAMGFAIKEGYRSQHYPFLETRKPTDTLSAADRAKLGREEKGVLAFKKIWLASQYPEELARIIAEVIADRKDDPISNVIILGIGSPNRERLSSEHKQFTVLSQVIAQLASVRPELLGNMYAQDPGMSREWKALFENHGFKVVEDPAAFELVNENSLLVSAFVPWYVIMDRLRDRPTRELGLLIGSGGNYLRGTNSLNKVETEFFTGMLDTVMCKVADVPCDRPPGPLGKLYEAGSKDTPPTKMSGLSGWDIWWRPCRTDEEKLQTRFDHSRSLRFTDTLEEFRAAYDAGYKDLYTQIHDRILYNFIMARYYGNTQSFLDYFLEYQGGMTDQQKKYDLEVARYISIQFPSEQDDDVLKRTFQEYLDGWRNVFGPKPT